MNCPKCDADARCYDSRPTGRMRRRRYQCMACGERFSTIEQVMTLTQGESAAETLQRNASVEAQREMARQLARLFGEAV